MSGRREFLKNIGQGSAALGLGLPAAAWSNETRAKEPARNRDPFLNRTYQVFEPGRYLDWERSAVESRLERSRALAALLARRGSADARRPAGEDPSAVLAVSEAAVLKYNHTWDPYNPLFNGVEYARNFNHPSVPAWPCFVGGRTDAAMDFTIPKDIADTWYYANDGSDYELFAPIHPGDQLTSELEDISFEELTEPGSTLRHFKVSCAARLYNQAGALIVRNRVTLRNGYRKILDDRPKPTFTENMSEWTRYFPPAHYTTDEEWVYIRELWDKEYIRGQKTLYWEDVNVGDMPPWTCSGPVSHMDMMAWYGGQSTSLRGSSTRLPRTLFRDAFGIYLPETAPHYGSRNIPGARMVFYNDTACKHVLRLVTNYIGDAGLVTRVNWYFKQLFREMQVPRPGGEYLDRVPHMKGKGCTDHGSEGDTIIGKAYVTGKRVNENGDHLIDLTCWGETLDNRIIQVVTVSAKLPSRGG